MRELFHFDIETCGSYPNFTEFKLNDPKGAALFQGKFDKMNWEEKYGTVDEAYLSMSGVISTYGRICCISYGFQHNGEIRINSSFGTDEKEILIEFKKVLERVEKKNYDLCGFRILYFDIPFILHKMHKYDIDPPEILKVYDKKPWEMRVRDISEDWRQKFAWSFSFDEVCYEIGVESPKTNMNGSHVHDKFWSHNNKQLEEIKDYCESDVRASIQVENKIYR